MHLGSLQETLDGNFEMIFDTLVLLLRLAVG